MTERLNPDVERPLSVEELERPTPAEVEDAIREMTKMVEQMEKQLEGKLLHSDPEFTTTRITF